MKVIIVSGTPGTGKTTLAKSLFNKLKFHYLDANKIISKYRLSEGYDKKRKTMIVDIKNLNGQIIKEMADIKKTKKADGIIIDSHLSHYLPKRLVDFCIITKCDIKELNKRLKKKGFHKEKIKENLQSEIFDICLNEARERGHKLIEVDTTKGFNTYTIYQKIKSKI
ncbi:adenylate kinase family protein [Candidatus Woesearchaeota archaeon]|nr:adenylate kinase family protein [Candidatus Woesearchaeota archaeon]